VMNGLSTSSLLSPALIEKTFTPTATRASLIAFVADGETAAALEGCLLQLSIRDATIKSGGIAKAIRHLGAERSPENIIVDISLTDMPVSQVQDLAQLCEPGVTVIAIGDRNDIGLYRDLVQAGVSDYVVKPITPQLLAKALSPRPISADRIPVSRKLGKMVAFVGARGGVGTTTLAINLAWYLADRQKRRVLLLDLDLQNGDCALALNVSPTPGLCDALANPQRIDSVFLERAMVAHSERLFVLSTEEPLHADVDFGAEAIETLVGALRAQFHYIIVDVPRLPGAPYRLSLGMADIRVIVADQTLRSVRDTVRLQAALGGGDAAHRNLIVANRSGEGGRYVMTLEEMAKVDLRPNVVIPFRPKLFTAAGLARHSRFTKAVAVLAKEISGHMPERTPWWRSVR
jgi:pilus assembly protein CpaE